jgi:hypothetical protein
MDNNQLVEQIAAETPGGLTEEKKRILRDSIDRQDEEAEREHLHEDLQAKHGSKGSY